MSALQERFRTRAMKALRLTNDEADILVGAPKISQTAHGFVVGDIIYRDAAASHAKAQADSEANCGIGLSIVIHSPGANEFHMLRAGNSHTIYSLAHGLGAFGTKLYLSAATAGAIVTAAPFIKVYLGYVLDVDYIHWEPGIRVIN